MNEERETRLWWELDRFYIVLVVLATALLLTIYYLAAYWDPTGQFWQVTKQLLLDVIGNIIPLFLAIVVSFVLLRGIQSLRNEYDSNKISVAVAAEVSREIREQLQIAFEDATVRDEQIQTHREIHFLKEFDEPATITSSYKNFRLIDCDFLKWQQCTIMLWVLIPPRDQGLRNAPHYRYLLAHRTEPVDNSRSTNLFALRYNPRNQWDLRVNNGKGEQYSITIDDGLDAGWHHFMISWVYPTRLTFRIDKGDGGQRLSKSIFAQWPEDLAENMAVGAWHPYPINSQPYPESFCETTLYQLWICDHLLEPSSEVLAAHYETRQHL